MDLIGALASAAGETPVVPAGNPEFNNVVLLVHADGTNGGQNNTFIDSSSNNFSIARYGNITQGSFGPFSRTSGNLSSPPYSASVNGASGYFDGSGDYVELAGQTAFSFGTGAFTIEFWVYFNNVTVSRNIYESRQTTEASRPVIYVASSTIRFYNGTTDIITSGTVSTGTWYHVAVSRSGTSTRMFIDGTQAGSTASDSTNYGIGANRPVIGTFDGSSGNFFGYLSNLRVLKGTALYTSNFTPPTAPLSNITNTSLLLKFDNFSIFDNTGKNNLETAGNAQIDTTTKKYGTGSMEFDGAGDLIRIGNSTNLQFETGAFTIELWVYLNSGDIGSTRGLVAKGSSTTGWFLFLDSTQKVAFTDTTTTTTSSNAINTDEWNHIAVVRSGTSTDEFKIFVNGIVSATSTVSTNFNQTNLMYVGASRTGGNVMKGFIDDLRITKGEAVYTQNFAPPTQAFPDS